MLLFPLKMNPLACIQSTFPLIILSIYGSFALSQQAEASRQTRHARGTAGDTELEKLQLTEEELLQDLEDLHRLVRRGTEDLTSLNCPPCERLHCSPKKASKLNCKGEITLGVCNCCPRCAKVEGESCGGKWDYLGRCESGSECVPDTSTGVQIHSTPQGVCRRRLSVPGDAHGDWSHDQPPPGPPTCEPKCTPEFCRSNPKAICSATDNADVPQSCQGQCQHTSCLACQFIAEEPDCGRCSTDDFRCIRRYAKCLRRNHCSKRYFPCLLKETTELTGKFQCKVPDCSTSL